MFNEREDLGDIIRKEVQRVLHENTECLIAKFIGRNPSVAIRRIKLIFKTTSTGYEFSIGIKEENEL